MAAKSEKSLAEEKAEDQLKDPQDVLSPEKGGATDAQIKSAASSLPVYDEEARIAKSNELPRQRRTRARHAVRLRRQEGWQPRR